MLFIKSKTKKYSQFGPNFGVFIKFDIICSEN